MDIYRMNTSKVFLMYKDTFFRLQILKRKMKFLDHQVSFRWINGSFISYWYAGSCKETPRAICWHFVEKRINIWCRDGGPHYWCSFIRKRFKRSWAPEESCSLLERLFARLCRYCSCTCIFMYMVDMHLVLYLWIILYLQITNLMQHCKRFWFLKMGLMNHHLWDLSQRLIWNSQPERFHCQTHVAWHYFCLCILLNTIYLKNQWTLQF